MTSIPNPLRSHRNLTVVLDIAQALGEFGQQRLDTHHHTIQYPGGWVQLWAFSARDRPQATRVFAVFIENGQLQSWQPEARPLAEALAYYRQQGLGPRCGQRAISTRREAVAAAIAQHLPDDIRIVL